jgi:hypothetical protein
VYGSESPYCQKAAAVKARNIIMDMSSSVENIESR